MDILSDEDVVCGDAAFESPVESQASDSASIRSAEDSGDEISRVAEWEGLGYDEVTEKLKQHFDMNHYKLDAREVKKFG